MCVVCVCVIVCLVCVCGLCVCVRVCAPPAHLVSTPTASTLKCSLKITIFHD